MKLHLLAIFVLIVAANAASLQLERSAQILSLTNELRDNGLYNYQFDTTNGISANENGLGGYSTGGNVQYISPEGIPIVLSYIADANGFRATGNHLPTPPPTPDYILKSLEFNRREEEKNNSLKRFN